MATMSDEDIERLGKQFTEGVIQTLGKWFLIALFIVVSFSLVSDYFRWGYDSSDDLRIEQTFGQRSDMQIRRDAATGCQYLESSEGHLTPRLEPSGAQLCVR